MCTQNCKYKNRMKRRNRQIYHYSWKDLKSLSKLIENQQGYEGFNHTKNQIYKVVQSLFSEYSGIKQIMNQVMGKSK